MVMMSLDLENGPIHSSHSGTIIPRFWERSNWAIPDLVKVSRRNLQEARIPPDPRIASPPARRGPGVRFARAHCLPPGCGPAGANL
jgi:hypothetical protein